MRDSNGEQNTRYAPRSDRRSFSGPRDWKNDRRDSRDQDRDDSPPARETRSGGRGGPQSGGRPPIEELDVFRLAHDLAQRVHRLTGRFPAEERGSLAAMLRRASAAVPAQLAAGDRAAYGAAINNARDAAAEARYLLLLTKDVGHLSPQDCDEMRDGYDRVARMLSRLAQALDNPHQRSGPGAK
jgi:four helix bundle protein